MTGEELYTVREPTPACFPFPLYSGCGFPAHPYMLPPAGPAATGRALHPSGRRHVHDVNTPAGDRGAAEEPGRLGRRSGSVSHAGRS